MGLPSPAPTPLSHHEILALVAPFSRAGRQLDLAASDRPARRLRFRPVERHAPDGGPLQETLQLDCPASDERVLTRLLTRPGGLEARLVAEGPDAAALLARIEAVDPARQWHAGPAHGLALSHRLPPAGSRRDDLLLTHAEARAAGLVLHAHAGDAAFSMPRTLLADLPALRTPWEQVLRTRLARGLAPKPEVSWSRPSRSYLANQGRCGPHRRMPLKPGMGATRAVPRLAVVVNLSGSIEGPLLERFAAEIDAITRRLSAGMGRVIGDDQVRTVEHCRPGRSTLPDASRSRRCRCARR